MATAKTLLLRIAAGLTAMLLTVAAAEALAAPGPGPGHPPGKPPEHGKGPEPAFTLRPGFCASYPEHHLMRHPHHGGFGYFRMKAGRCLWVEGPPKPQRLARHAPEAPPVIPVFPADTATSADTPYCREYQDRIRIGGEEVEAYGTACLMPEGDWKLKEAASPFSNDYCREFQRTITVGPAEQEQTGTACLRPGPVWEIVRTQS
jgi:surface antigen